MYTEDDRYSINIFIGITIYNGGLSALPTGLTVQDTSSTYINTGGLTVAGPGLTIANGKLS